MRRVGAALLLVVLAAGLAPATAAEPGPRARPLDDSDTGRVIVKYRAGSTLMRPLAAGTAVRPLHAATLAARTGLAMKDRWVLGARTQSVEVLGASAEETARLLRQQADVEWAEPVRRKRALAAVPNDPYYAGGQTAITPAVGQWYLRAPDSTLVSAINAVGAWSRTTGSASVTVAVLDTGVRFDHPDLTGKLYAGYDFVSRTSVSNDGDGRDADASDPGDGSTAADSCGAAASSWHGTQTAGIVGAASDNGIGMASVGRDVMVLPVRVLGKCGGYDDDILAAMRWAGGLSSTPTTNVHPAQVINMSLGSSGSCSASYGEAIAELNAAGVVVVVAAGNDEGRAVGTPANCSGAVAVGGLRHTGTKVGYSDVGPEIAISAPAGNCVNTTGACLYPILTTTNAGTQGPGANGYSDSLDYSVGTSFSAPMVAGAVALMLSIDATLTPATVTSMLKASARAFPTSGAGAAVTVCHAPNALAQDECYCTTSTCGAGMLDVAGAVRLPPVAAISASATSAAVGQAVTLDAGATKIYAQRTASYAWSVTAGSATLAGATGRVATVTPTAAGTVTVQLVVTDSAGETSSATASLTASGAASAASTGTAGSTGSGGVGGGAMSPLGLLLLAAAVAVLWTRRPDI